MNKKKRLKKLNSEVLDEIHDKYAEEAKAKWGDTEAYKLSKKRTSQYTKEDWEQIQKKADAINRTLVNHMDQGVKSAIIQETVEKWRQHICTYFYECSPLMLKEIGEGYFADKRFKDHYDSIHPGLAEFFRDAIVHYYYKQELKSGKI